jgi:hypothetical protein
LDFHITRLYILKYTDFNKLVVTPKVTLKGHSMMKGQSSQQTWERKPDIHIIKNTNNKGVDSSVV